MVFEERVDALDAALERGRLARLARLRR